MPVAGSGPGSMVACQPTKGMPAALTEASAAFCSIASNPETMMPSGFRAMAWLRAAVRVET